MSTMNPPTRPEQAPDELDALLRAFFQAQMPKPWPAFKAPATPSAQTSWWVKSRSRLALAASVALLLLGSWWLSGSTANYKTPMNGISPGDNKAQGGVPAHLKPAVEDKKTAPDANH